MKATKFEIIFETFFGILMYSIKLSICEAHAVNLTATQCGIPDNQPILDNGERIIGGHDAKEHSWPWMVSIQKLEGYDYVHHCGGSLVTRNKVLTAAHCFKDDADIEHLKVKLGLHLTYDKTNADITEVDIKRIKIHEKYNSNASSSQYDIALLTLYHPVNYTGWISQVCIGEKSQFTVNSTCFVTGWGRLDSDGEFSADLKQLLLPIIDDKTCMKVNPKVNATTQFCGGDLKGGKDSCQGDSGGPVVCHDTDDDSQWRIYGIVSYGSSCAKKDKLGVYTRVSFFRRWLHEHINDVNII